MGYDIIGDIHGQAGKMKALLKKLGYWKANSGRAHWGMVARRRASS
jgi:hypothetical protein